MKKSITKHENFTVYNMRFYGIADLYDYLKSNPKTNTKVFSWLASAHPDEKFAGEPLDKAIEYLLKGYDKGFDNFLKASKDLSKGLGETVETYTIKMGYYGGVPVAPLVAAGIPECMLTTEVNNDTQIRNVYFNLSYPKQTTEEQIRNRGLATLYIIQALESVGVMVNFKAFDLSKANDELFHLSIDLMKPGETRLNIQKVYYLLVAREFLRRIDFRVLETSDVQEPKWQDGFGYSCSKEECQSFYHTKKNDIVIAKPKEMGITGDNIYKDTLNLIEALGLENSFDTKKLRRLSKGMPS